MQYIHITCRSAKLAKMSKFFNTGVKNIASILFIYLFLLFYFSYLVFFCIFIYNVVILYRYLYGCVKSYECFYNQNVYYIHTIAVRFICLFLSLNNLMYSIKYCSYIYWIMYIHYTYNICWVCI